MSYQLNWQYQAKAEPLEPTLTTAQALDWIVQQPEPVIPTPPEAQTQYAAPVEAPAPAVVFDWIVQHPEPVLPVPQASEGQERWTPDPSVFPQNLDWLIQHPGPPPALPEPVRVGAFGWDPDPSVFPQALDWLIQHPEPPKAVTGGLDEGLTAWTATPATFPQNLDWIIQHPTPPDLLTGGLDVGLWSGVTEPTLIVAQSLDWLQQHPEPPLPRYAPEGGMAVWPIDTPGAVVVPDFDYYIQHPDPPLPEYAPQQPWSGITEPTLIVAQSLDWAVQGPEPVSGYPHTGLLDTGAPTPLAASLAQSLDWLLQSQEPVDPQDDLTAAQASAGVNEPTLFTTQNLGWLVQQPEPVIPTHQTRPGTTWDGVLDETLYVVPTVPDFGWYVAPPGPPAEAPNFAVLHQPQPLIFPMNWVEWGPIKRYYWTAALYFFTANLNTGTGERVYARLKNKTTGVPIGASEVSSVDGSNFELVESATFIMDTDNDYQVEVGRWKLTPDVLIGAILDARTIRSE